MKMEPSPEVSIETQAGSRPDVTIMKVSGPLTIRNFFEFQDATRSNKSPVLIIDMGEVPFLDSAALGSVLGLHVSCEKNKRKYGLVNVNARLQTMFTVCGVQDVLVTFPNLAEAEAALA
jgi:anti-anti-sigma factor